MYNYVIYGDQLVALENRNLAHYRIRIANDSDGLMFPAAEQWKCALSYISLPSCIINVRDCVMKIKKAGAGNALQIRFEEDWIWNNEQLLKTVTGILEEPAVLRYLGVTKSPITLTLDNRDRLVRMKAKLLPQDATYTFEFTTELCQMLGFERNTFEVLVDRTFKADSSPSIMFGNEHFNVKLSLIDPNRCRVNDSRGQIAASFPVKVHDRMREGTASVYASRMKYQYELQNPLFQPVIHDTIFHHIELAARAIWSPRSGCAEIHGSRATSENW